MQEFNWKRPELEDRELITSFFRKYPSRDCERTFANAYLWSRRYGITFAIVENTLVFRMEEEPGAFSYPVGEPQDRRRAIDVLKNEALAPDEVFAIYNFTPEEATELEMWYPGRFEVSYNRDYADYVYESERLIHLSGKKLHGKRNHINRFKEDYPNWSFEPMTQENLEECFQMALSWRQENGCAEDEEKNAEMCVTLNLLRLFNELKLTGGILKVNEEIIAFTIGQELCEDTFVIHVEKAFSHIRGAYAMINQQFAAYACKNYRYINREDDTGVEGLRKAKLSYRPAFLVEKGFAKEKKI